MCVSFGLWMGEGIGGLADEIIVCLFLWNWTRWSVRAWLGWDGMACLLLVGTRSGWGRSVNAVLPFCSFLFSYLYSSDICLITILKTFHSETYTYRNLKHGFLWENYCCVGRHRY